MYFTRHILTYRSYQNGPSPPPFPTNTLFKAVHKVENNIFRISLEGYSWIEMFILFRLPDKQTKHKTTFINSRSTPQRLTIILTLSDISTIYNLNHSSCTFSKPQHILRVRGSKCLRKSDEQSFFRVIKSLLKYGTLCLTTHTTTIYFTLLSPSKSVRNEPIWDDMCDGRISAEQSN